MTRGRAGSFYGKQHRAYALRHHTRHVSPWRVLWQALRGR